MARADSTIRVNIIGDVRNLTKALTTAETGTAGLLGSAARVFLASKVVGEAFDIIGGGLENADTLADALTRIQGTTTPEFAQSIKDIAFGMSAIGLSAPEVGTLAANFTDLATAAEVSQPLILAMTPKMLELASAIAATTGKTVDEVVTDIGKAAQGSQRPVAEYGVVVDSALNPDQLLTSIIDQLIAKYPNAKQTADDFAGSQDELNTKWDNFTTKLGEGLEGPLKGVVDWMNDMIDAIPSAMDGWGMLGDAIVDFGEVALTPLARVADVLGTIDRLLRSGASGVGAFDQNDISERKTVQAQSSFNDRNGVVRNRIGGV